MKWHKIEATKTVCELHTSGPYVISCWPEGFILSYRPPNTHKPLGQHPTLEAAKQAAEEHREGLTK